MYAMNAVILSILAAWASASPAVVPKANVANVNMYSGSSCGGSTQSFTVTDGYRCQPVSGAKASISVSEKYVPLLFNYLARITRPKSNNVSGKQAKLTLWTLAVAQPIPGAARTARARASISTATNAHQCCLALSLFSARSVKRIREECMNEI
ncbi:hypothetical protein TruAng_004868 [Truncatella angustata]|nr:hypothetical protein TruAng_004868 [Truncatella angustata]